MNCGAKATKKTIVFGLKGPTATLPKKAARGEIATGVVSCRAPTGRARMIVRNPRPIRYRAPAHFRIEKAHVEAASSAPAPARDKVMARMFPTAMPTTDASAVRCPEPPAY